jgi:hypothetical protein
VATRQIGRSSAHTADMTQLWRTRCQALEEKLQDTTAALRVSEAARLELSADYKHALNALWRANAGMMRRER